MSYLFIAYVVIWLALFAYMLHLSGRRKKLSNEIDTLKKLLEEKK